MSWLWSPSKKGPNEEPPVVSLHDSAFDDSSEYERVAQELNTVGKDSSLFVSTVFVFSPHFRSVATFLGRKMKQSAPNVENVQAIWSNVDPTWWASVCFRMFPDSDRAILDDIDARAIIKFIDNTTYTTEVVQDKIVTTRTHKAPVWYAVAFSILMSVTGVTGTVDIKASAAALEQVTRLFHANTKGQWNAEGHVNIVHTTKDLASGGSTRDAFAQNVTVLMVNKMRPLWDK